MKWKRTDEESAKTVREQLFLLRYKSELGLVEFLFPHLQHTTSIAALTFRQPMVAKTALIENTVAKDC